MKVGNLVGGLEVIDVKRVNKLNLIQFLKEVDSYLQQGYKLDVNSARQVGLVLQVDLFKTESTFDLYKTEASSSPKVGSTSVEATGVKEGVSKETETKVEEAVQAVDTEAKEVESAVESTPVKVEAETPVKKSTTTRSKKTTQ